MSNGATATRVDSCCGCGRSFEQERRPGGPRRYCDACRFVTVSEKRCAKCGETKPAEAFYADGQTGSKRTRDGLRAYCKACDKANAAAQVRDEAKTRDYRQTYYLANAARLRSYDLQRKYGITQADYDEILESQGGRCAICGSDTPGGQGGFHVDHDHKTDIVRGLLCHLCNTGLGLFADDPERLRNAIAYLEENQ